MKKALSILLGVPLLVLLGGCATRIRAVPLSAAAAADETRGAIPYYLPKPYLVVARNVRATGGKEAPGTAAPVASDGAAYTYQIVYLPDLRLKYGVQFTRGSGTYDANFALEDGWRFTGLTAKADAKTPETIAAVGGLIKELTAAGLSLATAKGLPAAALAAAEEQPASLWIYEIADDMTLKLVKVWSPASKEE